MRAMLAAGALVLLTGTAPAPEGATVHVVLTGLRSSAGEVRACLWHEAASFPDCRKGQDVRMAAEAAAPVVRIDFTGLAPGDYAVSVIHDENDNRKLDRSLVGIPTEGVGFSGNPRLLFGPPSYKAARFTARGDTTQEIRIRYFL